MPLNVSEVHKTQEMLDVEFAFGNENGSEYYEFMYFYDNGESVKLDGEFTKKQLLMIANVMNDEGE